MDWKNTLFVVGSLALLVFYFMRQGGSADFSGADARRLVQSGAQLVDVRTREEFAAGHIDGAVNIPVQELQGRMAELVGKDKEIVLYCRSGNRSGTAARMLQSAGYVKVYDLGAMSRW